MKRNTTVAIFERGAPEALPDEDAARARIEFFGPELPHERVMDGIVVSLLVIPGMLQGRNFTTLASDSLNITSSWL